MSIYLIIDADTFYLEYYINVYVMIILINPHFSLLFLFVLIFK